MLIKQRQTNRDKMQIKWQIRIAKLHKDAEQDDRNTNITVTLAGKMESYSG